jgi:hypothetical protein
MWAAAGLKPSTWMPRVPLEPAYNHLESAYSQLKDIAIVYVYFISRKLFYLWKIIINPFLLRKL